MQEHVSHGLVGEALKAAATPVQKWFKDGHWIMIERPHAESGRYLTVTRTDGGVLPNQFSGKFDLSKQAELIADVDKWATDNGYTREPRS